MDVLIAYNKFKNKVHIGIDFDEWILCGSKAPNMSASATVDLKTFIEQPDPESNLCKRCRKIAMKYLKASSTTKESHEPHN